MVQAFVTIEVNDDNLSPFYRSPYGLPGTRPGLLPAGFQRPSPLAAGRRRAIPQILSDRDACPDIAQESGFSACLKVLSPAPGPLQPWPPENPNRVFSPQAPQASVVRWSGLSIKLVHAENNYRPLSSRVIDQSFLNKARQWAGEVIEKTEPRTSPYRPAGLSGSMDGCVYRGPNQDSPS
jgi:hypothetical protein